MTPAEHIEELLFSYGTLQQDNVQRETFRRVLEGRPDAIIGYTVSEVVITDPMVIGRSGSARHPILVHGEPSSRVAGTVFALTATDLAAADDYEVDDYVRIRVPLESGSDAWVYTLRPGRNVGSEHG